VLQGRAKARSGGSAQRDQRNGAERRNPASTTQGACLAAKKFWRKKAKRRKKKEEIPLNSAIFLCKALQTFEKFTKLCKLYMA